MTMDIGNTYGRLTILRAGQKPYYVICSCSCGTIKETRLQRITSGYTRSCGCLSRELTAKRSITHGFAGTPIHRCWTSMLSRCRNPKVPNFPLYGGRGITVCERWTSFANFLADMGNRPGSASLDRIDNNGNYSPANCRWAIGPEQQRNRRSNTLLTIDGQTHCISEWAEIAGLKPNTIHERLRRGWLPASAVTSPAGGRSVRQEVTS